MKKLRYLFEAALVHGFIFMFRLLPLDQASNLGGWIGRTIGAHLAGNRTALQNLERAMPERADEHRNILRGMWDNLGRTFAEYPHLQKIANERVVSEGEIYLKNILEEDIPCVLFTGHLANWEIPAAYANKIGINLDLIYRAPNNFYVDAILQKYRSLHGGLKTYPKSKKGMRDVFLALKKKRRIGILIDQKYNQGLATQFFGRTAMTSASFAQMAQRFDCPLHAARVERLQGANFKITVYPAIKTKDRPVEDLVNDANSILEGWIRERPEQWLWLHRRWKD